MTTEPEGGKCVSCGFVTANPAERCPRCNRPWQTDQQVRGRGLALIVLGGLLSGGMTLLLLWVSSAMYPALSQTRSSFNGTRGDAVFIFGILGAVLVLGLTGFIAGVWQVVTGQVNRALRITMLAEGLLVLLLALNFYFKS
ncbi:MAG: hypothetical protein HYR56_10120 [Acidobacteria bacterium]|nr:hypothetical protein [Acidobacteriota bacterium]MBI3423150.1 hypothetical protein [Acidobacteriota bacterium]